MKVEGVGSLLWARSPRPEPNAPLGREWVDVLREVPLFAGLSKRHLRRLADAARGQRFAEGAPIVRKGQRGESFFVILDGEAEVTLPGRRSRKLKAGDFFGELALLDGEPRSATITATAPTLTLRLSRRKFLDLAGSEPELALGLLKGLAGRLRSVEAGR
jgi:CRP-like cAMP-binding protein